MSHFADIDDHGAEHDNSGRSEDTLDERPGEDTGIFRTGRPSHHGGIDGLNAKGLSRWAVHEDV